ncbi:MAG: MCE family protein [Sandaracinaceae bacterium]|nr:MCE family protein [Sandaracinaceae bacterium]
MDRSRAVQVRVGVFVVAALTIASALIFVLGSRKGMFGAKTPYHAVFSNVGGLRPGSPLRIAGVDVGTVGDVELRNDGRIHVELKIGNAYRTLVRNDSIATIGNKGLLGDRLIDVTVGRGTQLQPGATLRTNEPGDISALMSQAADIVQDARTTVQNLRSVTGVLAESGFQNDIRSSTHSLAQILDMTAQGNGTFRRVMTDPELANNFNRTIGNIQTMTNELARTARGIRDVTDEVSHGDGTVHEVIYGQSGAALLRNLASASDEAAQMLAAVRTGDGTVHDLIYENGANELIRNANAASGDIRAIIADVRAGRGTLGGLLTDPSIYEDIKRLVGDLDRNEILRALVRYSIRNDEPREAARVDAPADAPAAAAAPAPAPAP